MEDNKYKPSYRLKEVLRELKISISSLAREMHSLSTSEHNSRNSEEEAEDSIRQIAQTLYSYTKKDGKIPNPERQVQILLALRRSKPTLTLGDLLVYDETSHAMYRAGDYTSALTYYESKLRLADEDNTAKKFELYMSIAKCYWQLGDIGQASANFSNAENLAYATSLDLVELLTGIAECKKTSSDEATALNKGSTAYDTYEDALREIYSRKGHVYEENRSENLEPRSRLLIGRCLRGQGDVRCREGYITGAVTKYHLALTVLTPFYEPFPYFQLEKPYEYDGLKEYAHTLNALGSAYNDMDDSHSAFARHLQAKEIFVNILKERLGEAWCNYDLGNALRKRSRVENHEKQDETLSEAKKYFSRSLQLANNMNVKVLQAYAHRGLGNSARYSKQNDEAEDHFSISRSLFEACDEKRGSAWTLLNKAKLHRKSSSKKVELETARAILLEAQEMFKSSTIRDQRGEKHCDNMLGRVYYLISEREKVLSNIAGVSWALDKAEGSYLDSIKKSETEPLKEWTDKQKENERRRRETRFNQSNNVPEEIPMHAIQDRSVGFGYLGLAEVYQSYLEVAVSDKNVEQAEEKYWCSEYNYLLALQNFRPDEILGIAVCYKGRAQIRYYKYSLYDTDEEWKLKQMESAFTYFLTALQSFESLGDEPECSNIKRKIAEVKNHLGQKV